MPTDKEYNEALTRSLQKLDLSEQKMQEEREALNAKMRQHGITTLPPERAAPDLPDVPPCDYCGTEFAGKMMCSMCQVETICVM